MAGQAFLVPIKRGLTLFDLGTASVLEQVIWYVVAALLLGVLLFLAHRKRVIELFGLTFWALTLLPATVVLFAPGTWPGLNRWLYIGMPGLILAIYGGLQRWLSPRHLRGLWIVVCLVFLALTQRAILAWRSDVSIWVATTEENPMHFWGYRRLAVALIWEQSYAEAYEAASKAVELAPDPERDSCTELVAVAMAGLGQCEPAVTLYKSDRHMSMVPVELFAWYAASCFEKAGDLERARRLYRTCAADYRCHQAQQRLGP